MRNEVADRLLQINEEFYQRFGRAFAETRRRLQPGVRRVLESVPLEASVLDLGCGSGGVAWALAGRAFRGCYVGVDWSRPLLEEARARPLPPWAYLETADLSATGWSRRLTGPYDWIFAFALVHHLPGQERRLALVREAAGLMAGGGRMAVSVWNFMASARLRARVLGWDEVGLRPEEVEKGDCLLDWRHGGRGLRYVHQFAAEELAALAREAGLTVKEQFSSDGEGGQMGLYQVWLRE